MQDIATVRICRPLKLPIGWGMWSSQILLRIGIATRITYRALSKRRNHEHDSARAQHRKFELPGANVPRPGAWVELAHRDPCRRDHVSYHGVHRIREPGHL